MGECTVVALNATTGALILSAGGVLGTALGTMFWQVIKAKNDHITYIESVNADLTEINRETVGIAGGALKKVPHTGRRGGT